MFSIFHVFADLVKNQEKLFAKGNIEKFPFNGKMFSCRRTGNFPDIVIRVNAEPAKNMLLSGGELIEIKDSISYGKISSFNSTIPAGAKHLKEMKGLVANITKAGENVDILPVRQVYYLVRGRKKQAVKVCLMHGSFFETVKAKDLIPEAFRQVLNISDSDGNAILSDEDKHKLSSALVEQSSFASTRHVKNASVSLRFRVMTEAEKEANILQSEFYPEIKDNTVNLIMPVHGKDDKERKTATDLILSALKIVNLPEYRKIQEHSFLIKHPLNGYFWVLQYPICQNDTEEEKT